MIRQHAEFFKSLLFLLDMLLICAAWAAAYYIRFHADLVDVPKGVPGFGSYAALLPVITVVWALAFRAFDLYRPRRIASRLAEVLDIGKACSVATLVVLALGYFLREVDYSRLVFVLFWGLSVLFVAANRWLFRELLRLGRRRGYNRRYALIVGAGTLGQELAARLRARPELGLEIIGYLTRRPEKQGRNFAGIPVLGRYEDLPAILERRTVDQVFLALPYDAYPAAVELARFLRGQTVDVRIVPDLHHFIAVRGEAELLDGLPLVTLQASPLYGWNRLVKRAMDVLFSAAILLATSPLLVLIAILVRFSTPGAVLYRQRRMGYDGRVFEMLKFRSMRDDAENGTGAVWAQENDTRRTAIGRFLRRTSLDEMPQFFNVLKGDMSIVGPRPERPELVEKFRAVIPNYMLRHKIKAGITGLAQVNGWRGNTSLDERIRCDLEYIETWSLGLDFKIMLLTFVRGLYHKNAY